VIRQNASYDGFNIELVDAESPDQPFNSLSSGLEKKIWRQVRQKGIDAGIQFGVLFFCLSAKKKKRSAIVELSKSIFVARNKLPDTYLQNSIHALHVLREQG
jgi:hypothetical protein